MKFAEKLNLSKGDRKKITYLLALAAVAIIFLIFVQSLDKGNMPANEKTADSTTVKHSNAEDDMAGILCQIKGVGKVSVALEYDGVGVKEYGYNEEESSRTSGADGDLTSETTTNREMVLLNGEETPVVVSEKSAVIKGVLVVAEGARNPKTKEKILKAVTTYLDIGANKVEICAMGV